MTLVRFQTIAGILLMVIIGLTLINRFDITPPALSIPDKRDSPNLTTSTALPRVSVNPGKPQEARWQSQVTIAAPTLVPYVPPVVEPVVIIIEKNCTTEEWKTGTEGCTFITDAVDNSIGPVTADTPPIQQPSKHCTSAEWAELSKQNYPKPSGCTFITDVGDDG